MLMTFIMYGAVAFVAVAVCLTLWVLNLRRIVDTSEVHVVQRAGSTTAYGVASGTNNGNAYYEFPSWLPFLGVTVTKLPTGIFDRDLKNYEAYDKDRLPFMVDVKAFFRISDFSKASIRVSSIKELEEQLDGIVQGAVRSLLAKEDLEIIMSERAKYGNQFTEEVTPQLKEWGVETVKNIELMDIKDAMDSKVIQNIMAKKSSQIEMESKVTVAENLKKASNAEIAAKKEIALQQQEAEKEVGLRKATVRQEVGIADEQSKQQVQEQTKITTEKEMEVKQVQEVRQAEIARQAAVVKANQDKEVIVINANAQVTKAEADKKVVQFNAQAEKDKVELKAQADLTVAMNDAKGIEARGEANANAESKLKQASVQDQLVLAEKIGENEAYQEFMNTQKQIEIIGEVGKAQAVNLGKADIKLVITSGNVQDGITNATNIFNPSGALNLSSALEAFKSTPIGSDLIDKVLGTGNAVKAVETVKQVTKKVKEVKEDK